MLYEALFTVNLPAEVGPPLPTGFFDGVERLLFSGTWSRRMATCSMSTAAVLAGAFSALRTIADDPTHEIVDDAGELLDLAVPAADWSPTADAWAEVLPPRWTTEPCDFRLRTAWQAGGFATVVVLRHTPRHDAEQSAIAGAIRVLWAPEALGPPLAVRLEDPDAHRTLARLLQRHGDRVAQAARTALQETLRGRASSRSRLVVLAPHDETDGAPEPNAFADLLAGFPPDAIEALPAIRNSVMGWWPALSPSGVEGRFRDGAFVPTAEVHDVV